jgi:hypothetical protein
MILLLALFALVVPQPSLRWTDHSRYELSLSLTGTDPYLAECLNSGLPLRYQYSVQLCERESAWFDSCGPQRELVKTAKYSPISEQYSIESEGVLGTTQSKEILTDIEEVTDHLMMLNGISLRSLLETTEEDLSVTQDTVLKVRVVSVCDGEVADLFTHPSYFLTMGMYRMSGFNSGWIDIPLKNIPEKLSSAG